MNKFLSVTALVLLTVAAAAAQSPSPTPPSDEVVRISTSLIQLDVSVTDRNGKPIADLRPEEIEVLENGKKQKVTGFSFVSDVRRTSTGAGEVTAGRPSVLGPPTTRQPRPEDIRRTIALVVDDLTLSFTSTYWVKDSLKKFVKEQMQEGDLVAIVRTNSGVGALQQFTTNKAQLLAAIDKIRFDMSGAAKLTPFAPIQPSLKEQLNGSQGMDGQVKDLNEDIRKEANSERMANDFREAVFTSGTLGAISYVVRGMDDLPGRKAIVLVSDGLRLYDRNEKGMPTKSRVFEAINELTELANRASVVIYTIDSRGLVAPGAEAADNTSGLTSDQIAARLKGREQELRDTQDGMQYLAQGTGGFAFINQNDINTGIRRVLDDQSYYLVAYDPGDDTFDARTRKFNKIEVRVTRPGARVRYRSGFFGVTDSQIKKPAMSGEQALFTALSSPFASNDISLRLNALYASDDKRSSYLRSFLAIDGKGLTFTDVGSGQHKASFDLIAMTFGPNGAPVDSLYKNYTITLPSEAYKAMLTNGLTYNFTFPVKKAGGYQMRVAIRDTATNLVGSANQFIQVPDVKSGRTELSGIVFDNPGDTKAGAPGREPQTATAQRQFRRGTVLRYALDVYNLKPDWSRRLSVTTQMRLFSEDKVVHTGPVSNVQGDAAAAGTLGVSGTVTLGRNLAPGTYTLEVSVADTGGNKRSPAKVQYATFEIVP